MHNSMGRKLRQRKYIQNCLFKNPGFIPFEFITKMTATVNGVSTVLNSKKELLDYMANDNHTPGANDGFRYSVDMIRLFDVVETEMDEIHNIVANLGTEPKNKA